MAKGTAWPPSTTNAAPSPGQGVSIEQVDGGPGWYGRFSNPLPSDASFFPIGVWGAYDMSQANIDVDKSRGLNTYVWLADASSGNLPGLRASGMHALLDSEWWNRADRESPANNGYMLSDEADMIYRPGNDAWNGTEAWNTCIPTQDQGGQCGDTVMSTMNQRAPADGRLRYANYGKGVTFWETDAEAARFVNDFQDLVSADNYWFTDEDICAQSQGGALLNGGTRDLTAAECHRAANYATVRRLRSLMSPAGSRPVWAFVELGHPFSESDWPTITPPQVQAAVWQSLIAGARGIIYFQHSFGGPCETQQILRDSCYTAIRSAVTATNRRIVALAPVLNAPTVSSGWSQGAGTMAMVKWSGGHFYVFAGSAGSAVSGTLSIPCVGDATATVLDESRTIPVRGGSFTDSFADGNTIHIYRIDGRSTCGLPVPLAAEAPAPVPGTGGSPGRRTTLVGRLPRHVPLRSGRLAVPLTCVAACSGRSSLTTGAGSKRILLAAAEHRFGRGRHHLVLRLSTRARGRIARARRPISVRLHTVIAESGGGGAQRTQRLIVSRR